MRLLVLTLLMLSAALFAGGCGSDTRSYQVTIVVPDQFRGLVRLQFEQALPSPRKQSGRVIFTIPASGILKTGGENPFLKWGEGLEVRAQSGEAIKCAFREQHPAPDVIMFRTVGGSNDGKEYWAVVGTEHEQAEASLRLGQYESTKH